LSKHFGQKQIYQYTGLLDRSFLCLHLLNMQTQEKSLTVIEVRDKIKGLKQN